MKRFDFSESSAIFLKKPIESKKISVNMNFDDNYIGIEEAAQYLGISVVTLRLWIKSEEVPAHKIGKLWKFKRSELDDWVNSGKSAK